MRKQATTLLATALLLITNHPGALRAADPATNAPRSAQPFSLGEHTTDFHADRTYDLPGLLELSLANNPYTRTAWFHALAARASVGQAKSAYYPTLDFKTTGGYAQNPYPTQDGPLKVNSSSIAPEFQLEYLLLDFGRRAADVRNTVALLEAANLNFNRKMQSTVFAVQQSYFAHAAALAQQEAAAANLALSQTTLQMLTAQKNSGLATEPDLLIAMKGLSEAEFEISSADRNAQVTLGNLRTASGLPANAPLKVAALSENVPLEMLSGKVDQLIDAALANRPDLAARNAEIRASQAATERAKAEFLPKLSLQGDYENYNFGFYAKQGSTAGTYYGSYNEMGAFAVLSWDLFDGFERVEKVKKRQAEEAEARANADATSLGTTRDVWTAYNDSLKARKQIDYTASLLASARENHDSLQAAFQNGLATITDLSASQSALANARFEKAGAVADYLTSLASLSLAIGQFSPEKGNR